MNLGFDIFGSRMVLKGSLTLQTALRIGTGRTTDATESNQPVLKDSLGRPLIPGASLKGALRSYLESILRTLDVNHGAGNERLACDLLQFIPGTSQDHDCIDDFMAQNNIQDVNLLSDQVILDNSCVMCRLFGSPHVASRLYIRDLAVNESTWGQRYIIRDGVSIDRDTGTAADQRKYDLEVVPAATQFNLHIQVDNASQFELGLVLLLANALEREQILLGGGRSRGLGTVRLENPEYRYTDSTSLIPYLINGDMPVLNQNEINDLISLVSRRLSGA